jgi:hypothetical protein
LPAMAVDKFLRASLAAASSRRSKMLPDHT